MNQRTPYFTWKPKSWGKNHGILFNIFLEITRRRKQPPYYNDFRSPATIGRRLQPPNLHATTWRKLQLHSSLATIEMRLQPPFLDLSYHPNMKIETVEPRPHWSCKPTNQHLYYTAQFVPHYKTTSTTNQCSSFDHYSSTNHCSLYHTAQKLV